MDQTYGLLCAVRDIPHAESTSVRRLELKDSHFLTSNHTNLTENPQTRSHLMDYGLCCVFVSIPSQEELQRLSNPQTTFVTFFAEHLQFFCCGFIVYSP